MPRPCSHLPGDHGDSGRCSQLTSHRSGLCPRHLAAQRARTDAARPTSTQRGYDSEHRADAATARARGQTCQHPGCTRTDVHRDHIDGNQRNNSPRNIQWLCATHHGRKTATQDVHRDAQGRILPSSRPAARRQTKIGSAGI